MKDNLNIGYEEDVSTLDGRIKKYARDMGADEQTIIYMANLDFEDFRTKLKMKLANEHEDGKITKDDIEFVNRYYTNETYYEMKESLLQTLESYKENDVEDDFKFPSRELLNGNFPRLDKTKLSNEEKKAYNVDGLLDEEFDVYYNEEAGVCIPVYYNISTKNINWFNFTTCLSKLYSILKIDANPFLPLITFDRDLLGLDCLCETYSNEINGKIEAECEKNIIFTQREVARYLDGLGNKSRLEITLGDWTWLWLYAQCFNTYREAPRQTGKTFEATSTIGNEWAVAYKFKLLALIIHFKSGEAIKNKNKMVEMANCLPRFLKKHLIKTKTVRGKEELYVADDPKTKNSKEAVNQAKSNILKTVAVGKTETSASQAGRGDTSPIVYIDEINFIPMFKHVQTAITFAQSTARTIAQQNNLRYGIHYTSTAGKLHTKYGREMYDIVYNKMCRFEVNLFDYSLKDLEIYLKKNSSLNFFVIKYEYNELGYSEEWLDSRISMAESPQAVLTEVFQKWLNQDSSSLFTLEHIKRMEYLTKNLLERKYIFKMNYPLSFFPENENQTFEELIGSLAGMLWGVDVSAGGGDYSVIYAIDIRTLKPVFTFKTNNLVVTDFAIILADLMRFVKELNPSMLFIVNPEQNGPGLTLIPILIRQPDLEPHIFRTLEYYDAKKYTSEVRSWHRKMSDDTYLNYGSNMNKRMSDGRNLRHVMFEQLLFEIVDKYPYAISTTWCLSEVLTLYRKAGRVDGKIEAKPGFHDDIICAALHALTPVLVESLRRMLKEFWNYIVDISYIHNMSLDTDLSYMDISKTTEAGLDEKIDYKVETVRMANGTWFQKMHLFRYLNGIRTEVEDETETMNIISDNPDLLEVFGKLKQLTAQDLLGNRIGTTQTNLQRRQSDTHSLNNNMYNRVSSNVNSRAYRINNTKNKNAKLY